MNNIYKTFYRRPPISIHIGRSDASFGGMIHKKAAAMWLGLTDLLFIARDPLPWKVSSLTVWCKGTQPSGSSSSQLGSGVERTSEEGLHIAPPRNEGIPRRDPTNYCRP